MPFTEAQADPPGTWALEWLLWPAWNPFMMVFGLPTYGFTAQDARPSLFAEATPLATAFTESPAQPSVFGESAARPNSFTEAP